MVPFIITWYIDRWCSFYPTCNLLIYNLFPSFLDFWDRMGSVISLLILRRLTDMSSSYFYVQYLIHCGYPLWLSRNSISNVHTSTDHQKSDVTFFNPRHFFPVNMFVFTLCFMLLYEHYSSGYVLLHTSSILNPISCEVVRYQFFKIFK